MVKKICYLVTLLLCHFVAAQPVAAAGEFTANYDVSYAIAPTGVTIVTQTVALVNRQTNLYPKQYTILLDTLGVRNIIARDDGGTITPKITQNDGKTEILLTFNKQVVGLGKQTQFTLRYENLDIAAKNGSIWEVNIPGITGDADLGNYNVTIATPPTFGSMSYLKPPPADGKQWNRRQMTRGGISAAYGERQYAKFTLRYYLENPGVTTVTQEIALPPDTAFQQVSIDALNPKPIGVARDDDGNWLARYSLKGGQKLSIEAVVSVTISLSPNETQKKLDEGEIAQYLKPLPYWEADDPAIKTLAATYTTPKAIYDYVVSTLSYDYERVKTTPKRKGAIEALKTPKSAICMEFTDLFIAIARAAGIPARESVGYAHTTNAKLRPLSLVTDVLHAWPEYYDRESGVWIPVDPTWGNTTGGVDYFDVFDFNHIVFAIHGKSSSQPLPAGFYRENSKEGKDVTVDFLESASPVQQVSLIPRIDFPKTVTAGFRASGMVTVENTSGIAAEGVDILISTEPLDYTLAKADQSIGPYSTLTIPVSVAVPEGTAKGQGTMTVTAGERTLTHSFDIQPISWLYLSVSGMIGSLGVLLWIIVVRPFSKKAHKK
ncbi:MAG: Transglutaminase family protein [Microgenomates group bacterium GW2011_GWA2_46_16]|nr:MAG: Transglutaminase family protein [Microgenomates group bacterium GW2011_GWA2_46_16]